MASRAPQKVLIAGGGPAAIEAVLTLRELAPHLAIEVIAPGGDFVYRPLSAVEPFVRPGVRHYALSRLGELGVTVRQGAVARVDTAQRLAVTESGEELPYDQLLVAIGAGGGPDEAEAMHGIADDIEGGSVRSLAFVSPAGATWTLPMHELALQTADWALELVSHEITVTVVTAEPRPLGVLGDAAADLVEDLFSARSIVLAADDLTLTADRRITTALLAGRPIDGLAADAGGFHPVDRYGSLSGSDDVWAAGDCIDFPIKQGGLAAQQAETAARSIAAAAGYDVEVTPFEPVLRGMLVADHQAWSLRRRLDGIDLGQVSRRALWWPPSRIAGRRLAPFLDQLAAEVMA
jgi:sulfide:quinone oxidoreductase